MKLNINLRIQYWRMVRWGIDYELELRGERGGGRAKAGEQRRASADRSDVRLGGGRKRNTRRMRRCNFTGKYTYWLLSFIIFIRSHSYYFILEW